MTGGWSLQMDFKEYSNRFNWLYSQSFENCRIPAQFTSGTSILQYHIACPEKHLPVFSKSAKFPSLILFQKASSSACKFSGSLCIVFIHYRRAFRGSLAEQIALELDFRGIFSYHGYQFFPYGVIQSTLKIFHKCKPHSKFFSISNHLRWKDLLYTWTKERVIKHHHFSILLSFWAACLHDLWS